MPSHLTLCFLYLQTILFEYRPELNLPNPYITFLNTGFLNRKRNTSMRIVKTLVALSATLVLAGCTDPNTAQKALTQAGYSDITTGGYAPFSCGEDDVFKTSFSAKGPTGVPVNGTVCSGWMKGSTIRLD